MKKNNITIRGLSDDQYKWLKTEARRIGQTMTAVIKNLIQEKLVEKK